MCWKQNHLVVTLFLTMLIGAGGNAGNQSTIKVIEGMASGKSLQTFASDSAP
jgi:Mg/Co/Ni transporter MgtE